MRRTPRLRALPALLLSLALALLLATPSPARAQEDAVGGPQLATRGRVLPVGAPALPPEVVAHGWLVADLDTGDVLAAQDPHGGYAPASTLKVLTAVALRPRLPDLKAKVVPTFDDLNVDGSRVGLVERVGYPVDELFAAMLMVSGNDVANTLATAAGGPAAIAAMNDTARELQARDTHAVNASGLDAPGQTSSAYDLALLARAGMKDADFRRWVSLRQGSVSGPGHQRIATATHDKLLLNYPGALGIKNGYTNAAKASFVGAATRDGRTLVVTLMRTRPRVDVEAAALLDWGFAASRAGVAPVGRLVDPLSATPAASSAPIVPAAAQQQVGQQVGQSQASAPFGDGRRVPQRDGSTAPVQVLSAGAVAVTVLVLRRRRLAQQRARRPGRPVRRVRP